MKVFELATTKMVSTAITTAVKEKSVYKIVNYFDVWGNEKDGFEVNNLCYEEATIEVSNVSDIKEIIRKLKEVDFLASHVRSNMFDVWNDWEMIEFFRKNGKPLFRLELVRD